MNRPLTLFLAPILAVLVGPTPTAAQTASIREELRTIETYPFSEPDPVPILTRDERLYPYHAFQGYSTTSVPQQWKVVTLGNDLIEVFVLPEVGGKVWGAVIKETGQEFIYRNEVMKFRNISLRGPWTSGGIEFNFGVIGHTPATATPVDYKLVENNDGSVSCWVGTMDLPSRTHWRVEIRLEPGKAAFETNVLWYNPTPTWQPYYNWMTAAAFARDDLVMSIPGNRFLGHPGESHTWPEDPQGRFLPEYRVNTFGGHKSFHVVGERNDFFGGYYRNGDFGFGHWARHEELPGQKLWLWSLSRTGGIWEDLLTDTDGQYVEYQAGRLLVQYSPGRDINPITQASFDPGSADQWSELWFPVVGTGGLSEVSRRGVLHVVRGQDEVRIGVNAFQASSDTLVVSSLGNVLASLPVELTPLEPFEITVPIDADQPIEIDAGELRLHFASDRGDRTLSRPFETDPAAIPAISEIDLQVREAKELVKARRLTAGRSLLETALREEPWHRDALVALADLDFRTARYQTGLAYIERARQLDAYDAEANFVAGNLYRAIGQWADASDAFGWAARSMAFRSTAYTQLADLSLMSNDWSEATRWAKLALDYDRYNLPALGALAIALRRAGGLTEARQVTERMLTIDPLNHGALAERFLQDELDHAVGELAASVRNEFPEQTLLELAIDQANRGQRESAALLLSLNLAGDRHPILRAWKAYLDGTWPRLPSLSEMEFAFPYRAETLPVLEQLSSQSDHWSWSYLYALNLWALGQTDRAREIMISLGQTPALSSFYLARASLTDATRENDLLRAQKTLGAGRLSVIHLIRYYQGQQRWSDAAAQSATARGAYPDDFNLALLHARSLLHLGSPEEAVQILEGIQVLPSENARESHLLFEWAHTMAGLNAIQDDDFESAAGHFQRATEWPEHLGQGKPYEPEERLARYGYAVALSGLGREAESRRVLERVVEVTGPSAAASALHALAVQSLKRLGRPAEALSLMESLGSRILEPGADLTGVLLLRALDL